MDLESFILHTDNFLRFSMPSLSCLPIRSFVRSLFLCLSIYLSIYSPKTKLYIFFLKFANTHDRRNLINWLRKQERKKKSSIKSLKYERKALLKKKYQKNLNLDHCLDYVYNLDIWEERKHFFRIIIFLRI